MREDAANQYLSYKLIESNQDWKAKWFYISNHHPELPKPSGKQPKHRPWWNMKPTMQEGIQLPELIEKIKALREAGLNAEHMDFSFMKRMVQPLMACDTLGYQYTGDEDTSRMLGGKVDDDDIVERLGKIFKDMLPYTPCPILEYSAEHLPNKVSSEGLKRRTRDGDGWEPIKILFKNKAYNLDFTRAPPQASLGKPTQPMEGCWT
jgi:hypothetical protein